MSVKLNSTFKSSLLLITGCLLLAGDSYASPCYGTRMPAKNHFSAGVQTNVIFNRYLRDGYGKLRSTQHFLLLSYGVFDWLSIDLKGGAGNIKQHPLGSDEVDYSSSFAGGYGLRLKVYDNNATKAAIGFQHISVHPGGTDLGDIKNKAILDDWQSSFLISRKICAVTPYLGIKGSRLDYIHWIGGDRKRKKSDSTKNAGMVIGIDVPVTDKAWVNLEGQLFDVEAVAFSLNFDF